MSITYNQHVRDRTEIGRQLDVNDVWKTYITIVERLSDAVLFPDEGCLHPELAIAFDNSQKPSLKVYYAPFDYVNASAKICLIGITPGRTQAFSALRKLRERIRAGDEPVRALQSAKIAGSFDGPMRDTLVRMLDKFMFNRLLGISSCRSLWSEHSCLVHFTSLLRYPVFSGETCANYTGQQPKPWRSPFLSKLVETYFVQEARALQNCLFVPLGAVAHQMCERLVARGVIPKERLLVGIEHPAGSSSGASVYLMDPRPRSEYSPAAKVGFERIDGNRAKLRAQIQHLILSS